MPHIHAPLPHAHTTLGKNTIAAMLLKGVKLIVLVVGYLLLTGVVFSMYRP